MTTEAIVLQDEVSGSQAKISAQFGFNCFQFSVRSKRGPNEVLWSAPDFDQTGERPSGSGIPILFPFPGRIRGTTFHWEGKSYPLEAGDGMGNAIHGFVIDRAWRVIESSAQHVVGEFQASVDDPTLLDRWPADFRIRTTYRLAGQKLTSRFRIENPDSRPLPFGFGTHPYFRVPLGGDDANACRVRVPVTKRWVLDDLLPTGKIEQLVNAEQFDAGLSFAEMKLDDVFSGLRFDGETCRCEVLDPQSGLCMSLTFDAASRECVIYNPPHREAVCIEPYTCVPCFAELQSAGHDAGLRVLPPGGVLETTIAMEVS
ncbi:MAG: aldose 1-epimerase [Pirellulaceae bacterium]|nr:aldose 1-epimerase [Pirellulaceae bacterium]